MVIRLEDVSILLGIKWLYIYNNPSTAVNLMKTLGQITFSSNLNSSEEE